MTLDNEQVVRHAYQIAENQDLKRWVAAFTDSERTAVLGVTATKLIPRLAALRPQTQPHAS